MNRMSPKLLLLGLALTTCLAVVPRDTPGRPSDDLTADNGWQVRARMNLAASSARRRAVGGLPAMSADERRRAVDSYWGEGLPTDVKLAIFDQFWEYTDAKFAAFQGVQVNWRALRRKYRPEIEAGVSRGRMAAIMNHMALALGESHTQPLDRLVNADTVPEPGVPLLAVGAWTADPSGTCATAMPDGSALVYAAIPDHPLGLEPGDVIVGYDGKPWRRLWRGLLEEEIPLWPLWWGSSPTSFQHAFDMTAATNWHLFDVMDIRKRSGEVVHQPTSLMPGPVWFDFCSEQLAVAGVPKPADPFSAPVSYGIVDGTRIGYIYVWSWGRPGGSTTVGQEFAAAVRALTETERVDGLVVDFRFNMGGFTKAPLAGIGALASHPALTVGTDRRDDPDRHFSMTRFERPRDFRLDIDPATGERIAGSYDGPVAVLVGPGALSAGDLGAFWMTFLPRARTFGKPTASAFAYPTQPALGSGTSLDLHPDWFARIAEGNFFSAQQGVYLTHREFPVDEQVWLRPSDVAQGVDTVVERALQWLRHHKS